MGTTTFNGPVRSENGFETVSKNATTGAITITSGSKMGTEAAGGAGIDQLAHVQGDRATLDGRLSGLGDLCAALGGRGTARPSVRTSF